MLDQKVIFSPLPLTIVIGNDSDLPDILNE